MYGSIHNHFESQYDTANGNFETMLRSFAALGAKKVAVTDHGTFSAFEDVRDTLRHLQESAPDGDGIRDMELVPGVEGYFSQSGDEGEKAHIILIAKDYEGYRSLCRILTQGSRSYVKGSGKPVITMKNLEENVAKGHLYCTSACIAGIFGENLGLRRRNLEEKLKRQLLELEDIELDDDFIIPRERLSSRAFEKLLSINVTGFHGEILPLKKLIQKERPENDRAQQLIWRLYVTRANKLIMEKLTDEKPPKSGKHKVNPLATAYFNERQQMLSELSSYRIKRPRMIKFSKMLETASLLATLPDEETGRKQNVKLYRKMVSLFGRDNFYMELQYHGLPQEVEIYNGLVNLAREMGDMTHFIVSNDVHVGICRKMIPDGMNWEEYLGQAVLRRDIIRFARYNRFFGDNDAISADSYEYYIKDDGELREYLKPLGLDTEILDNAFHNLEKVLSQCHVEFPEGENHYPEFPTGTGESVNELFDRKIREGIQSHFPEGLPEETVNGISYAERIEYESSIIKQMGYASYHLIVADYLEFGRKLGYLPDDVIRGDDCPMTIEALDDYIREHDIRRIGYNIGPGRGSAVGSICCFLLGITDIDPVPYNLLFERFLNPERVSMPDIDSDFRTDIRMKCIEYCQKKYGYDCVCNISTKSYAAIKGAIRLAGRYTGEKAYLHDSEMDKSQRSQNYSSFMKPYYQLSDRLCKRVSDYEEWLMEHPDCPSRSFDSFCRPTDDEKHILELAHLIEGSFLNYGQHAAGTIISRDVITDSIPLMFSEQKENLETQCNMEQAEAKGFLKMDFLGLGNLDIITAIMRKSGDDSLMDYGRRSEIIRDSRIYREIYARGYTQGVFQFESAGIKAVLQRFEPECFEDIILINAAYRPGPMKYINELIEEKWYRRAKAEGGILRPDGSYFLNGRLCPVPKHSINIDHPVLREILAPTYGCIIYQEQIMQVCQKLAGFSMGHADNIRKFMSKKKTDKLLAEETGFVNGCVEVSGISRSDAKLLFRQMEDFGKYAFNKSHATAYSLVSLFTAYLKLYHPVEFFTESLNAVQALDEIFNFTVELPVFGIRLLPPNLLHSGNRFLAVGNRIYYGLGYVKGLSGVSYTKADNFLDFVIHNRAVISESVMVKLVQCGLFDEMEPSITRYDLAGYVPKLYGSLEMLDKLQEKRKLLQEQLEWIGSFIGERSRLSLEDKIRYSEFFRLKKDVQKITMKDVSERIQKITRDSKSMESQLTELSETAGRDLKLLRLSSRHTNRSVLYNRKNEQELLGYVFDIRQSTNILEGCNTFPEGTVDCRTRVECDIPNLGLIVLNPKVKVTPGGWTKVLCCDRNRTYKHIYFEGGFPEDITEFAMTFREEKLQEQRNPGRENRANSNNMYVAPHAYSINDIGYTPAKHVFIQKGRDLRLVTGAMRLGGMRFHPTAYLHCQELEGIRIPCRWETLQSLLHERNIFHVVYED